MHLHDAPCWRVPQDLRRFLHWGAAALGYPSLKAVVAASPTAELEPMSAEGTLQVGRGVRVEYMCVCVCLCVCE